MHARNAIRRLGEVACISELTPEIKAAAEGEYVAEAGCSDLYLTRQLETSFWPGQHGRSLAAGMRRGEKKYSFHQYFSSSSRQCFTLSIRHPMLVLIPTSSPARVQVEANSRIKMESKAALLINGFFRPLHPTEPAC